MNVLSLFSGAGGLDNGLVSAGMSVVAGCEIDPKARAVFRRHHPGVPIYTDVAEVTRERLTADGIGAVDVVAGGFPCQDFSLAGRRAGMDGSRGGLWWEMHRVVDECRPSWVIGENVAGLLSAGCAEPCPGGCIAVHGGVMGAVVGSLGQLGYGVAWRVLDARFAGVAQRRRRVFIVGHPLPDRAAQVLLEPEGCPGDPPARRETGEGPAGAVGLGAGVACVTGGGMTESAACLTTSGQRIDAETETFVVNSLTAAGGGRGDDNDAQAGHLVAVRGGPVARPPRAGGPRRRDVGGDR